MMKSFNKDIVYKKIEPLQPLKNMKENSLKYF